MGISSLPDEDPAWLLEPAAHALRTGAEVAASQDDANAFPTLPHAPREGSTLAPHAPEGGTQASHKRHPQGVLGGQAATRSPGWSEICSGGPASGLFPALPTRGKLGEPKT